MKKIIKFENSFLITTFNYDVFEKKGNVYITLNQEYIKQNLMNFDISSDFKDGNSKIIRMENIVIFFSKNESNEMIQFFIDENSEYKKCIPIMKRDLKDSFDVLNTNDVDGLFDLLKKEDEQKSK